MLEVKNLTKIYGDTVGLDQLSFKCENHDILGILGHNGSGKTTLFRLLLGLIHKTKGEIIVEKGIHQQTYFGYLPEERSLYKDISVEKQIIYLSKLKKMRKEEIEERMKYWLERFELSAFRKTMIRELSKGNQQKVQFVCALIHNPHILILDEPLTGLDANNVRLFKQIMVEQSKMGKIILLSSHQYEELEEFCSQIILLKKGINVLSGYLNQLKQTDPRLCVTINNDDGLMYQTNENVYKSQRMGNYSRYILSDKTKQFDFLNTIDLSTITYIKVEQITLRDLVQEAS
ncbi:MAG: ATP-binding cassette domain-containing protein [Erysipelothrix sp.]|nr:ATP-binding cassette domain-containing protein [Erysipelothrix sp.]